MARPIIGIAIALLVSFSAVAHVEAEDKKPAKKGHVSVGMIVFVKHYDKASPVL